MTIPIPRRLQDEPLIEAIWQVLFEPDADQSVGQILPGMLYSAMSQHAADVRVHPLPAADIPPQVAALDPNLKFAARYRIEAAESPFLYQVGERVVTLNCRRPYAGWPEFEKRILDLVQILEASGLIPSPQRHSLRYIDLLSLESPPTLAPLKATLKLGDHAIVQQPLHLRVELPSATCLHVLQVVNPAEVNLPDGPRFGTLIDLETIAELEQKSWASVRQGLEGLHDASKSMFFQQILGEDAIARMKPEY